MKTILCIVGPTASGKSELALRLAEEFDAEILSCDSLLVYKDLQIGTAKPTDDEMRRVPHHGVNLVDANENYNAGDYVRYARGIIDDAVARKKKIIIVGGTGFYLKALLCGTWDAPPTQPDLRAQFEPQDSQLLYAQLLEKDPSYAAKIQANDRYRVIRALEIIEVTGMRLSDQLAQKKPQNPLPYPSRILGIRRSKPDLEKRIIARTNDMFSRGLVNETKTLVERFSTSPSAL
ncbi:MAG TPA: tRNA (adenosine(37)-N6)-dimethylallyltransferase MiaA, partial [Oligoflexia bacterium]|nr:tRNA (adenosine(37)-N6)-dimethylallyltransferase MiaA [Oligoflexia bacterium]